MVLAGDVADRTVESAFVKGSELGGASSDKKLKIFLVLFALLWGLTD